MEKWEYYIYQFENFYGADISQLSNLGNDGWEMVSAIARTNYTDIYLKRKKHS